MRHTVRITHRLHWQGVWSTSAATTEEAAHALALASDNLRSVLDQPKDGSRHGVNLDMSAALQNLKAACRHEVEAMTRVRGQMLAEFPRALV